ncbi:MAG: Ig-like domain-containing protein [Clostridia bacterium]|nr:Ig-like domain-containing protein [Clostridia bacterium]
MHKTKLFKIFILTITVLLSCVISVSAASASAISVGEVEGVAGDKVIVPITIDKNSGFVSLTLKVTYDTSVLTLTSVNDTGVLEGEYHSAKYNSPYQLNWVNDTDTSNTTKTGKIVELIFNIDDDAKTGKYDIQVSMDEYDALDAKGRNVSFTLNDGCITVIEPEHECSFGDWEPYTSRKHVRYCDECDEKELENHSWDGGKVIEEASCDSEGEIKYTCKDCGETKTEETEAEDHSYGAWMKHNEAQHKRSCSSCGNLQYEEHSWDTGKATVNGKTYTCTICKATKTIVDFVPVSGITLSETNVTLKLGDNYSIDATVNPANATNKNIIWTSSNPSVAKILDNTDDSSKGLIMAMSTGTATITATSEDGNFVANCEVTVVGDSTPDPNAPTIYVDNVTATAGKTVKVNISLKNNPGILGTSFTVSYSRELILISAQNGEALSSLTYTAPGMLSNPCRFGWDGVDESDADGVVLTLTFKIPDDAQPGDFYTISISYDDGNIFDKGMNPITFRIENGSIKIPNYTSGDLNDDGTINMQDVVLLRRHIVGGYNVVINNLAADVNRDGLLNMQDVVLIRRYIVGGYGVELK